MGLAHVRWAAVAEFGEAALRLLVHRRGSASAWRLLAGLGDLFEPIACCAQPGFAKQALPATRDGMRVSLPKSIHATEPFPDILLLLAEHAQSVH